MQLNQPLQPPLTIDLHGLKITFQSPDALLQERFELVYGHLPRAQESETDIFIGWHIHRLPTAPLPPPDIPVISEGALVSYYGGGDLIAARLPRYGLIMIDLARSRLIGAVTRDCLEAYGVFEDVLMISLAPLYRRRGWFPIHAFAAQATNGPAALITGEMGSGKTTTGLALLSAGWKLLSNDSPLLRVQDSRVEVLAYPGRLSAFDDSLIRFEHLRKFMPPEPAPEPLDLLTPTGAKKRVFRAEEAFEAPWAAAAVAGGVFFPQIAPGLQQSELATLTPKEALLQLLPQAIEGWDKAAIGQNLGLLRQLVEQAPAYILKLSPRMEQLPDLLSGGLRR